MFKLIVMSFLDLWRAEEVRLLALKQRSDEFESALAVQRKLDQTLTFNSIDVLNEQGIAIRTFWTRLRILIFQSPPLSKTRAVSKAFIETLAGVGINNEFVEQIDNHLKPGTSLLMLLVADHRAEQIHRFANECGATVFENDVHSDELQDLSQTIGEKIVEISKHSD